MRTLKCITDDSLRDRIRNGDIRSIREIQDVKGSKWSRIRRRAEIM